jgi:uncharacterized protein (TIGR00290 family)
MKERVILTWSGGKDSAMTLCKLQQAYRYEVTALVSNINEETELAVMHDIPLPLLQAQAESAGIPLHTARLPTNPPNDVYEARQDEVLLALRGPAVDQVAFGDIFIEDIREFRDAQLSRIGMKGIYPLWGRNSIGLAHEFIDLGFKAIIVCVDTTLLDADFVGRQVDESLLAALPKWVDPCGENGEFHTFVYDGPIFKQPIAFEVGETYRVDGRFAHIALHVRA